MLAWTTAEWASVVAAIFTALAAFAALGATALQLYVLRRSRTPELSAAVRQDSWGRLQVVVANAGSGLAVHVGYVLVHDGELRGGVVGGGFIAAGGEGVAQVSPLPTPPDPVRMVWTCRDIEANLHVWSTQGGYRRVPRRRVLKKQETDLRDHFRRFYPDVPMPTED